MDKKNIKQKKKTIRRINIIQETQILKKKIDTIEQKVERLNSSINSRLDMLALEVEKVTSTAISQAFTQNPTFVNLIKSLNDCEFEQLENEICNKADDVKNAIDNNEERVKNLVNESRLNLSNDIKHLLQKLENNEQDLLTRLESNDNELVSKIKQVDQDNKRAIIEIVQKLESIETALFGN